MQNLTKKKRILFLVTEDWYFYSHRLCIARAAREIGYEVLVAARFKNYFEPLKNEGFKLIPISLRRKSMNPIKEIFSILEILNIYKRERPDIVHHIAIKPILYGSWAARIIRVPAVINTIPGLGYVFVAKEWKARILKPVIKLAYKSALSIKHSLVIFQNPEDRSNFINSKIIREKQSTMIKSSGVNVSKFKPTPEQEGKPIILLASRMIWDKGVGELVKAARILKKDSVNCRVVLVGDPDPENPASISKDNLNNWNSEAIIEWWGYKKDMVKIFEKAHIVVLPTTYGEGIPKVLIEAAASGRPIVANDMPGCREIVRQNINGLLVPPRDEKALAEAIKYLVNNPEKRKLMGERGREIAVSEFSEEKVVKETLAVYEKLL